jgi:hypothetical protein
LAIGKGKKGKKVSKRRSKREDKKSLCLFIAVGVVSWRGLGYLRRDYLFTKYFVSL